MKTKLGVKRWLWRGILIVVLVSLTGCQGGVFPGLEGIAPLYPVNPDPTQTPFVAAQPTQAPTSIPIPTSSPRPTPSLTPEISPTPAPPILYYTQAGDTLHALEVRFGVSREKITSPDPIPEESLFNPGQLLIIPSVLGDTSSSTQIVPDSEIVYSPSALDFDTADYVHQAGGYINSYKKWFPEGWFSGAQVIQKVATENSINPRLLTAILEYQSHWVFGQPENLAQTDYPIGFVVLEKKELYYQLSWAVQQLNLGYYGWREGLFTDLTFQDGTSLRLAPDLNAGTVAVLYLFAKLYDEPHWAGALYGPGSLSELYETMFGSPWMRAQSVEPLFPATLTQPPMELPFSAGKVWSFTGGPHSAWGPDGARAALDFAPSSDQHGCFQAEDWVTAMADGLVVREETGVVVVDLDGDGYEQTGWAILYLHIATEGKVPLGSWVMQNERIGRPSCEGGKATGTHVHIARKYNGEWILADGPLAFELSGWRAHAGEAIYDGWMTRGEDRVDSSVVSEFRARISR
jgi:LasA protease